MSNVVIDASMASAWLIPDEQSEATDAVLRDLPGLTALVPTLFRHEIRNVIVIALRRGRIDSGKAAALLAEIRGLTIEEVNLDDDAHILSTGSSLATLDARLASAAKRLSIGLVGPLAP